MASFTCLLLFFVTVVLNVLESMSAAYVCFGFTPVTASLRSIPPRVSISSRAECWDARRVFMRRRCHNVSVQPRRPAEVFRAPLSAPELGPPDRDASESEQITATVSHTQTRARKRET